MKYRLLYLTISLCVVIIGCTKDQPITDSVFLTTQAEVDKFNYTYLPGDLTINGDLIDDLSPLCMLTHIGGTLSINDNNLLGSLSGLENLARIDSGLIISNNYNLKTLDGLEGLKKVGTYVSVYKNRLLLSLNALSQITDFTGSIDVRDNDNLESLFKLKMTTLDCISISRNKMLCDLKGLECIEAINTLVLEKNSSLVSFIGLQNLIRVENFFAISGNSKIESFKGLEKLEYAGSVWIGDNEMLLTLDGLNSLKKVKQSLVIGGYSTVAPNAKLDNYCAISNLVMTMKPEAVTIINNRYNPTYIQFLDGKCFY